MNGQTLVNIALAVLMVLNAGLTLRIQYDQNTTRQMALEAAGTAAGSAEVSFLIAKHLGLMPEDATTTPVR